MPDLAVAAAAVAVAAAAAAAASRVVRNVGSLKDRHAPVAPPTIDRLDARRRRILRAVLLQLLPRRVAARARLSYAFGVGVGGWGRGGGRGVARAREGCRK